MARKADGDVAVLDVDDAVDAEDAEAEEDGDEPEGVGGEVASRGEGARRRRRARRRRSHASGWFDDVADDAHDALSRMTTISRRGSMWALI